MYTDDNGIVRFEESDNVSPLHTALNTALQSVSNSYDVQSDDIEAVGDRVEALEDDTGWMPLNMINTSNFEAWSATQTPAIRRIGKVVEVRGAARCTTANHIIGTTRRAFAKVPAGYGFEPGDAGGYAMELPTIMQASGTAHWHLAVFSDGTLNACRYGPGTTHNNNLWLPFQMSWLVD